MGHNHLTTFERGCIEALSKLGYSNRAIALKINRHHSCIDRELKRNSSNSNYKAQEAQSAYEIRRHNSKPKGKLSSDLVKCIEEKLIDTWSPEQIANTITLGKLSFKTIYNWIYAGKISRVDKRVLRHKGKRMNVEKRGKFSVGTPISKRPKEVTSRETFGHWELDTMLSSRGKSKGCLATFIERKSRLYIGIPIPDRTAANMKDAIKHIYKVLPQGAFKTGTTDRGKEFACYQQVKEEIGITLYFADAYCSWQRGSNENANGLLREFYPKKTDLANIDHQELMNNLYLINNRPRKCLGWNSPIQIFLHELAHLT